MDDHRSKAAILDEVAAAQHAQAYIAELAKETRKLPAGPMADLPTGLKKRWLDAYHLMVPHWQRENKPTAWKVLRSGMLEMGYTPDVVDAYGQPGEQK